MAVKIKTQRDYLVTEVSMELPVDLNALDSLMKVSRATGKIVAVYTDGGVNGVNVEQRAKISAKVAEKVRELVGVETEVINGN
jgi:hypothetical protein